MSALKRAGREASRVEAFYHDLGYETVSDVFDEAGIPHVEMEKVLVRDSWTC